MWTKENLEEILTTKLKDYLFVVVSNREPYIDQQKGLKIETMRAVSGVTSPLDNILQTTKGIWIAHGGGDADKKTVDDKDHIKLPPHSQKYTLRRVWLSKNQLANYYYGFSNECLWPLCHLVHIRPTFKEEYWSYYKKVNKIFSKATIEEVGDKKAFIWIQDYHFALLPKILREKLKNAIIVQFWHIPWPTPDLFRIMPWKKEILEGLLSNHLIGFHINLYVRNFLETVASELEAKVDWERNEIEYKGHKTLVRAFPISVDYDYINKKAKATKIFGKSLIQRITFSPYEKLCLSVDRMDYTKGIMERLKAIDKFLEKYPQYQSKFVYINIYVPSRTHIKEYQNLFKDVQSLCERINWKYSVNGWFPIILLEGPMNFDTLIGYYKSADVLIVSPLDDGMNLVSKEYISACNVKKGTLILSKFTGAARELSDAIQVNPYNIEEFADAIKSAVDMPLEERQRRMKSMKELIKNHNVYRWTSKFLLEALNYKNTIK